MMFIDDIHCWTLFLDEWHLLWPMDIDDMMMSKNDVEKHRRSHRIIINIYQPYDIYHIFWMIYHLYHIKPYDELMIVTIHSLSIWTSAESVTSWLSGCDELVPCVRPQDLRFESFGHVMDILRYYRFIWFISSEMIDEIIWTLIFR